MEREEIIRMVREAGLVVSADIMERKSKGAEIAESRLRRLIEAVGKAEREACAKIAENGNFLHDEAPDAKFGRACAKAIRARSNVEVTGLGAASLPQGPCGLPGSTPATNGEP